MTVILIIKKLVFLIIISRILGFDLSDKKKDRVSNLYKNEILKRSNIK